MDNLQLNRELSKLALWSFHTCMNDLIFEEVIFSDFLFRFQIYILLSQKKRYQSETEEKEYCRSQLSLSP